MWPALEALHCYAAESRSRPNSIHALSPPHNFRFIPGVNLHASRRGLALRRRASSSIESHPDGIEPTHSLALGQPSAVQALPVQQERTWLWLKLNWQTCAVLLLVSFQTALFTWALLAQHRSFNSNGWDLAWFDQIVWNTAQGRPFETSFADWNFLGEHVEPVLLLFAAVYRVKPDVEVLLLTQVIVGT